MKKRTEVGSRKQQKQHLATIETLSFAPDESGQAVGFNQRKEEKM
jgi:hypothetical protein